MKTPMQCKQITYLPTWTRHLWSQPGLKYWPNKSRKNQQTHWPHITSFVMAARRCHQLQAPSKIKESKRPFLVTETMFSAQKPQWLKKMKKGQQWLHTVCNNKLRWKYSGPFRSWKRSWTNKQLYTCLESHSNSASDTNTPRSLKVLRGRQYHSLVSTLETSRKIKLKSRHSSKYNQLHQRQRSNRVAARRKIHWLQVKYSTPQRVHKSMTLRERMTRLFCRRVQMFFSATKPVHLR